jgi:hypothetical protein
MRPRARLLVAAVTACATSLVVTAAPAAATPVTTGASAASVPAFTGSASLAASLSLTGSLGGLLNGLISPIVTSALNPLVAALQGSLTSSVYSALGLGSGLSAGTPSVQAAAVPGTFPGDLTATSGLPSPCTTTSTTQPCYSGSGTGSSPLSLAPLVSLGVGALRGYTEQQSTSPTPIFGRSQVASASVSVLPAIPTLVSPLVSVGTVDAKANCPSTGAPTASVSSANVTVLGGTLVIGVANGTIGTVTVGGNTYNLGNLPTGAVAGLTLAAYGTALEVGIPLTLSQVLTGLGLGASAVTELLGDALPNASLTLGLVIGPNSQVTANSATAWGLGIGVDLSGSLGFNLLGLVGATVSVPTGIGGGNYGNLLDARLAYAACTSGTTSTSGGTAIVPPALI